MSLTPEAQDNPLFVTSLEKGMGVLSALATAGRPLSLAEISRLTGISRSAAQRFVYTLRTLGYLVQDPASKYHMLSARMLEFGEAYSSRDTLTRIAYSVLEAANRECGETINLTVLDGVEVIYVLRFPCRHVVSVNLQIGSRLPAYCTAPGRAMMAHLDGAAARQIFDASDLEKRTPYTETDRERLRVSARPCWRRSWGISRWRPRCARATDARSPRSTSPCRRHAGPSPRSKRNWRPLW
jgi:IclR family pca regulon transcriptional regulator